VGIAAGPEDPNAPQAERVAVFHGSRPACHEYGLVLEAKGLTYDLSEHEGMWALLVAPAVLESARDELARYAAERRVVRDAPAAIIPFEGAVAGAGVYALVLLIAAYCAGIQLLGIDWLATGALQPRAAGGGGEWWRAVTALTLHLDQAHLLSNLLFGVGIGILAGRVFGPGLAWASIVAAGALGNYLDMLISPPTHRAVGASTAVFAALGLLAGFAWRQRLPLRERFRYRWARGRARTCARIRGRNRARLDLRARRRTAQPRQPPASSRRRRCADVHRGGLDLCAAPPGGGVLIRAERAVRIALRALGEQIADFFQQLLGSWRRCRRRRLRWPRFFQPIDRLDG
jgi:rhomboid protease GluP